MHIVYCLPHPPVNVGKRPQSLNKGKMDVVLTSHYVILTDICNTLCVCSVSTCTLKVYYMYYCTCTGFIFVLYLEKTQQFEAQF